MNDNTDFKQLDALLAQPALIADKNFSEGITGKIGKLNSTRRRLFIVTGLCWIALVIIVASPQALYNDFSTLALSLDITNIYPYLLSQIQSLSNSIQMLPYPVLAAGILSLAAIVSMTVRV